MQNTIKDIKENKEQPEFKKALNVIQNSDNALKEKRKFDKNWTDWKKFVWLYLQKSNTIGGFIVFPTTHNSINFRRGNRYDLYVIVLT